MKLFTPLALWRGAGGEASYPLLDLILFRTHFVTIDAEALGDICPRECFLHILYAVSQSRAFVSGEGNDGLTLQVVSMLLEDLSIPVNRGSGISQRGKYPWLKPAP